MKGHERNPVNAATTARRNSNRPSRLARAALLLATLVLLAAATVPLAAGAAAHAAKKHKPKAYTVKAKSGTIVLTLTAQAWSNINHSAGTAVGTATTPLAPATSSGTGTFTFPVTGGSLNSVTGRGTVNAHGGLMIESHVTLGGLFSSSSSASAESPALTLGSAPMITMTSANFSPPRVPMFTLTTAHIKVQGSKHSVRLSGMPVHLTAPGIQFLGSSFKASEQIGTASVQIKG